MKETPRVSRTASTVLFTTIGSDATPYVLGKVIYVYSRYQVSFFLRLKVGAWAKEY